MFGTLRRLLLVVAAASVVLTGCGDPAESARDAARDVASDDAHAEFQATLDDLGLTSLASAFADVRIDELTDVAEYTFFAPTDAAFLSLSADGLADLVSDRETLVAHLRRHVVATPLSATALEGVSGLTSASGDRIDVAVVDGVVMVGGAPVVRADQSAGDAVIHVIDGFVDAG